MSLSAVVLLAGGVLAAPPSAIFTPPPGSPARVPAQPPENPPDRPPTQPPAKSPVKPLAQSLAQPSAAPKVLDGPVELTLVNLVRETRPTYAQRDLWQQDFARLNRDLTAWDQEHQADLERFRQDLKALAQAPDAAGLKALASRYGPLLNQRGMILDRYRHIILGRFSARQKQRWQAYKIRCVCLAHLTAVRLNPAQIERMGDMALQVVEDFQSDPKFFTESGDFTDQLANSLLVDVQNKVMNSQQRAQYQAATAPAPAAQMPSLGERLPHQ